MRPEIETIHHIPRRRTVRLARSAGGALLVPVSEVMTRKVLCVSYDMGVETLTGLLLERGVSGAPVVEDGKLVGFVSLADVARVHHDDAGTEEEHTPLARTRNGMAYDPGPGFHPVELEHSTAAELMLPAPACVHAQTVLAEAAAIMATLQARQLVVVTEDKTVVGILSALDIARWVAVDNGFPVDRP